MDGDCRGDSRSEREVDRAKPQRGPAERADTLLQDTGRHVVGEPAESEAS